MVQVMVEVRSGRWQERRHFPLLECTLDTSIAEVKRQAVAAAVSEDAAAAAAGGPGALPDPAAAAQLELTFLGQACEDGKALRDYGVSQEWIQQVTGFLLRPRPQA